ncbi:DUF998 domain-containing protein [Limimaricola litoreus]|uniref:DUF998 domain-containing protein n=1 Tax=Limimaricola litoreus TaxID=2955316 RepID=A0A9X2FWC1_9RHOB|nr:DUF998 domain-containing protein [Limimaricola litoreus]MCP1169626.1 DUF998 domain-containing protein [Limimaricola litoreus]
MKDAVGQPVDKERPYLLLLLAGIGLFGCLSMIGGTIAAQIVVPGHDWIADTISDLGAGEWEIIMDVALYGFAAGLFAMALAASHAHLGGIGWSAGVMSLAILGALVVMVGARNEYGDNDSDGVVIHIYLVYGLGLLFLVAPLGMAAGFGRHHPGARWALIGLAVAWAVAAPLFLMAPTTIDGLAERVLGLIAVGMVAVMTWVFWQRGRDARRI